MSIFPKYHRYKESEVECLREISQNWTKRKVRYLFSYIHDLQIPLGISEPEKTNKIKGSRLPLPLDEKVERIVTLLDWSTIEIDAKIEKSIARSNPLRPSAVP